MKLNLSNLPKDVIKEYDLAPKFEQNGYVYVEIKRGMYGLPQAGLLAQQILEKRLNAKGYSQSTLFPGLWTHAWSPITFTLCVDDFRVKCVGKQHGDHLMSILGEHYTVSHYWTGSRYLGTYIDWDYTNLEVHLSMLSYVRDAIKRFHHTCPQRPQDQTYPHVKPTYGAKAQYSTNEDDSPVLSPANNKFIQEVTGTFLYYTIAIDTTILPARGSIATQQADPT